MQVLNPKNFYLRDVLENNLNYILTDHRKVKFFITLIFDFDIRSMFLKLTICNSQILKQRHEQFLKHEL